ncbi:MAG: hypothetical protein K2N20_06735 [Helicobacter sp.]|nr:hypothetical protein [Helicobacter sp.]
MRALGLLVAAFLLMACSEETQREFEENLTNNITGALRDSLGSGLQQLRKELQESGASEMIKNFLDDNMNQEKQKQARPPNVI